MDFRIRALAAVRMRPADPYDREIQLLEEIATPPACLTGGRISVWVYRDGGVVRELVLCGHAERRTCSRATAQLTEAAKLLGSGVRWMLTCGAAYFRVDPREIESCRQAMSLLTVMGAYQPQGVMTTDEMTQWAKATLDEADRNQGVLNLMVEGLREVGRDTGLVDVREVPWAVLLGFREQFRQCVGVSPPLLVTRPFPAGWGGQVADLMPIVPGNDPGGEPLLFRLEGWDFDCPEFQQVADRHLNSLQRELLGDALQRQRTYRRWLKEWTEEWLELLSALPENEARAVTLVVPPRSDEPGAEPRKVDVETFLSVHLASFIERRQDWHRRELALFRRRGFGHAPATRLDEKIHPQKVVLVDYERGLTTTRDATDEDACFTLRESATRDRPELIARCLRYIRMMDGLIGPYERLRDFRGSSPGRDDPGPEREVRGERLMEEISRRIVVETMVRGWPSFYIDDDRDRAVYQSWAKKYRQRIWRVMTRQAAAVGVSPEILLEDNVVYDVRFDDDLGCTIQPLMLVDDAAHAQIHGSRAGASVAVPLWNRRPSRSMPDEVLALGRNNSVRAARLVERASQVTRGPGADSLRGAALLRLALGCHPAEAGRLILAEWSRRLGRDTSAEFDRARLFVEASALCARHRYIEAAPRLAAYLASEPAPVPDALVMAACCELVTDAADLVEHRASEVRLKALLRQGKVLSDRFEAASQRPDAAHNADLADTIRALRAIQGTIEKLQAKLQGQESRLEKAVESRRALIEQALSGPASVKARYSALARAAAEAADVLRATLEFGGLYRPYAASDEAMRRYVPAQGIVELLGLLSIVYTLTRVSNRIREDREAARLESIQEIERLAQDLWLPVDLEDELLQTAEEFSKGAWGRVQTNQILALLDDANRACQERMVSKINDRGVIKAPLAEVLMTRIHLTQILEARYQEAFEMLLTARVPLGRAPRAPWVVLDGRLQALPAGARLELDPRLGTIAVRSAEGLMPLLRTRPLDAGEAAQIATALAEPEFLLRVDRFASSLAEGLLEVEIEPSADWTAWRDAMAAVRPETIFAISVVGYRANLMPDQNPPRTAAGQTLVEKMDTHIPRQDPDESRIDLSDWLPLLGPGFQQATLVVPSG